MTYGSVVEKSDMFAGDGGRIICGQVACGTSTTNGTIALSSYFATEIKFAIINPNKVISAITVTWSGTTITVENGAPLVATTLDFIAFGY